MQNHKVLRFLLATAVGLSCQFCLALPCAKSDVDGGFLSTPPQSYRFGSVTPSEFKFGFQVSGALPMGDFELVGTNGFGAAAFVEWIPGSRFGLRARGEYVAFGQKEGVGAYETYDVYPMRFNSKIVHLGAALDGVYRPATGFYIFAGIGFFTRSNNGTIEFDHPSNGWVDLPDGWDLVAKGLGAKATVFPISVGLGWYFFEKDDVSVGIEVKHATADASWVQAALCFRF